jgi:tetratricopeptide (TPR) repeat protein
MKYWGVIFILCSLVYGGSFAEAQKMYRLGSYKEALREFYALMEREGESPLLNYNIGTLHYRLGDYAKAREYLQKGIVGGNPDLNAKVLYNLGNTLFRVAQAEKNTQERISRYREAIQAYISTLDSDENMEAAKINLEFARIRLQEELDKQKEEQPPQDESCENTPPEPSADARRVLAEAMQLVHQGRYEQAKSLLQQLITMDPTAQTFQQHVDRIDDVIDILQGKRPGRPLQAEQPTPLEVI